MKKPVMKGATPKGGRRGVKPRLKLQKISMAGKSAFPQGPAAFPQDPGAPDAAPPPGAPAVGPAMATGPQMAAPGMTGQ